MHALETRSVARLRVLGAPRTALLFAAVFAVVSSCDRSSGVSAPPPPNDGGFTVGSAFPGNVSNAIPSSSAGVDAASADPEVALVSLPPHTVRIATSASIVNRRTLKAVSVAVVDGGLDPVPIGARASDTIVVTFAPDADVRQTWAVVPRSRRPVVVRTDPAANTGSVAVDTTMLIVFSEPIDPASVGASTVTLLRGDVAVAGTAQVRPKEPWIVQFSPAAPLTEGTKYDLMASAGVRDLDGESLESSTRVSLSTAAARGHIAFSRWDGSALVIYTMEPDGSRLRAVTQGIDPSFSPDGRRIAFWRFEGAGSAAIYIADADGSNEAKISEGYQPTWSPDGGRLAYGCGGICIINVDGTRQQPVTPAAPVSQDGEECIRDSDPAWSPDGTTIAFTRWPDARIPTSMCLSLGIALSFPFDFWTEVWLVGVDGSELRPIRNEAGLAVTYAGWPSWSPDGSRLAFYYVDGGEERIDVVDFSDFTTITTVRRTPVTWNEQFGSPAWSPDGRQILIGAPGGWGFAESSGSGRLTLVTSPNGVMPSPFSFAWAKR